jgi:hypothetical protein
MSFAKPPKPAISRPMPYLANLICTFMSIIGYGVFTENKQERVERRDFLVMSVNEAIETMDKLNLDS